MGDLQATVEFLVELYKFYNVDLFIRGNYQLRLTFKPPKCAHAIQVETCDYHGETGAFTLFPAFVTNDGQTAVSRTFNIYYKDEEVLLKDVFLFRVHLLIDSTKAADCIEKTVLEMSVDVHFTDQVLREGNYKFLPLVTSRTLQFHLSCFDGLHQQVPLLFDYYYFSIVDIVFHANVVALGLPNWSILKQVKTGWFNKSSTQRPTSPLFFNTLFGNRQQLNTQFYSDVALKYALPTSSITKENFEKASAIHRNLCAILAMAHFQLLNYFEEMMQHLDKKQRISLGAKLDPAELVEGLCKKLETLQSYEEAFDEICSDLSVLTNELALLWSQFQESFALNDNIRPILKEQHHRERMLHFSEAFFLHELPWSSLSRPSDGSAQKHTSMGQCVKSSRYLSLIPPVTVECAEVDGDPTTTPIFFEDRYVSGKEATVADVTVNISPPSATLEDEVLEHKSLGILNEAFRDGSPTKGHYDTTEAGEEWIEICVDDDVKPVGDKNEGNTKCLSDEDQLGESKANNDTVDINETPTVVSVDNMGSARDQQGEVGTHEDALVDHGDPTVGSKQESTKEQNVEDGVVSCEENATVREQDEGENGVNRDKDVQDGIELDNRTCGQSLESDSECGSRKTIEKNAVQAPAVRNGVNSPRSVVNDDSVPSVVESGDSTLSGKIELNGSPKDEVLSGSLVQDGETQQSDRTAENSDIDNSSSGQLNEQENLSQTGKVVNSTSGDSGNQQATTVASNTEILIDSCTATALGQESLPNTDTTLEDSGSTATDLVNSNKQLNKQEILETRTLDAKCEDESLQSGIIESRLADIMEPRDNLTHQGSVEPESLASGELNSGVPTGEESVKIKSVDRIGPSNDSRQSETDKANSDAIESKTLNSDNDITRDESWRETILPTPSDAMQANSVQPSNDSGQLEASNAVGASRIIESKIVEASGDAIDTQTVVLAAEVELSEKKVVTQSKFAKVTYIPDSEGDVASNYSSTLGNRCSNSVFYDRAEGQQGNSGGKTTTQWFDIEQAASERQVMADDAKVAFVSSGEQITCFCSGKLEKSSSPYKLSNETEKRNLKLDKAKQEVKSRMSYCGTLYSDLDLEPLVRPYFMDAKPDLTSAPVHFVICVHGLDGNSGDLRLLRCFLEMALPSTKFEFLMSEINQDNTFLPFDELTEKLVSEIVHHMEAYRVTPSRISFIGHSLGNIIIRSALTHPLLEPYIGMFHTFLSLSGPHLGMIYHTSSLVSTGLWLMQKWKKSASLSELSLNDSQDLRETFLYKLSQKKGLEYFSNVLLVSSVQDHYVPFHSSRIELPKSLQRGNSQECAVYREMMENILKPLLSKPNGTLVRYSVYHCLPSSTNSFIGRAAHIAMLDSELFIEKLICRSAAKYFQ